MAEWFFTSDLHGQVDFYEQALSAAVVGNARVLAIGGDLCPHAAGDAGPRHQQLFLEGVLVEFARRLREAAPGCELLLLMGNDDWRVNLPALERHDGALWRVLHDQVLEIDGVRVAGLSWVPITPFTIKDWERWEDGGDESPPRLAGWTSQATGLAPFAFDPLLRTPTIADALAGLADRTAPEQTLFVLHSPALGTRCDMISGGQHVGSRAIRAFVERHQPPLVLSGHIHESPRVSGSWRDMLGRSVLVNPGQFGSPRLCGAWFDPRRIEATLRHTVHA